jgi:cell division protein FtsX
MLKLILAELAFRRGRSLALFGGILVATAGFTLLTGASDASRLEVRGAVDERFETAYDILVRPRGSQLPLESREQLVQLNFLSGIFGGIRMDQYRAVRDLPGVEVAAPIAMIGFVLPDNQVVVPLKDVLSGRSRELFRVRTERVAERGLTRRRDADSYVYVTSRRLRPVPSYVADGNVPGAHEVAAGRERPVCPFDAAALPARSPFVLRARSTTLCWSEQTGQLGQSGDPDQPQWAVRRLGARVSWPFPFLIAAIDPREEARLFGIDSAIVGGRYLREDDAPRSAPSATTRFDVAAVPVIVSSRPYVDESAEVVVERLAHTAAEAVPLQSTPRRLRRHLDRAPAGTPVLRRTITAADAHAGLLRRLRAPVEIDGYWTSHPARLRTRGRRAVAPEPASNPPETWESIGTSNRYVDAPLLAGDASFRRLEQRAGDRDDDHPAPALRAVGTFDPERIPTLRDPDSAPLNAARPPNLEPGDATARRVLGGRDLWPSTNFAGYQNTPPLLLTTFRGLSVFAGSTYFQGAGRIDSAPISAIRVRVAGVTGADALSRERIRLAAQRIARRTGLAVDVTAGSSPTDVEVALPAGRHGRPALTLREGWVKKGVALDILRAIDRKSVILFALVLLVCAVFVANAATAAVRSRRRELGVLAAVGWRPRRIFVLMIGEMTMLGVAAGVAGAVIAVAAGRLLDADVSLDRAALAVPAATLLAVAAGLHPARVAARAHPSQALRPAVAAARASRTARTVAGLALTNLLRMRGRAVLGSVGLAVGVFALTVLLAVALAFEGAVAGSLLGDAVAVEVRGADYAAVAAIIALGALAVADVLYLNLRDRAPELATLRAVGWRESRIAMLVVLEGVGMGLAGALAGTVLGLAGAWSLAGELQASIVLAAVLAGALGVVAAAGATLVPAAMVRRLNTARLLAEE